MTARGGPAWTGGAVDHRCGRHYVQKEWRTTTFEYSDDGITVRVPNIYAWVCPESGVGRTIRQTGSEACYASNVACESREDYCAGRTTGIAITEDGRHGQ